MRSGNIESNSEALKERAEKEPEEVKRELTQGLRKMIKLGNRTGKNVKPEKRLYIRLKKSEGGNDVVNAIEMWEEERL